MTNTRRKTVAFAASMAAGLAAGSPAALAHGGDGSTRSDRGASSTPRGDNGHSRGGERSHGRRGHHGQARRLAAVAERLGVTRAQLRAAIADGFRAQKNVTRPNLSRAAYTTAVAAALGVTVADVERAREAARAADGREAKRAAYAAALGKTVTEVAAAIDKVEADFRAAKKTYRQQTIDAFYAAVASALGKDAATVKAAFAAVYGKAAARQRPAACVGR